jgi:hypothetical protein
LDVETRRDKIGFGWKDRKKGAECAMRRETIEHMWNGCIEMRERERKERGQTGLKGRLPDTNGVLERKEKEQGEEGGEKYYQRNGSGSEEVER